MKSLSPRRRGTLRFLRFLTMKKLLFGLILSLLLVGCGESISQSEDVIKIGGLAPLTGDAASYGLMAQKIINLRVKQINQAGGIHGKHIEILWEDGKCDPNTASQATQKLINVDKVKIITGFSCSGSQLAAAPIAEKNEVILMGSLTSSPEITHAGDFSFRTFASDASQGKILGKSASEKFQKIGMIVEQSDYAMSVAEVFSENFEGEIVREDFLPTESDFRTRITKLKNEDIEMIFLCPQSPAKIDILLKQLAEQNWEKPIWGNEMLGNDTEVIKKYFSLLEKNEAVSAIFIAPHNTKVENFIRDFNTEYGKDPRYFTYTGATVDSIDILAEVLKNVDDVNSTEEIRDKLHTVKNWRGASGIFSIDKNGDIDLTHTLIKFNGEEFAPLE